jgi:hypothetical protein
MINYELTAYLRSYLDRCNHKLHDSIHQLNSLMSQRSIHSTALFKLGEIYAHAVERIEEEISQSYDGALIELHRNLFLEWENLISFSEEEDRRFNFLVVIPVADRAEHLRECLHSLLQLCQYFYYGNFSHGTYKKITVFVIDDSKEKVNRQKNQNLASELTQSGLSTRYISCHDQRDIVYHLGKNTQIELEPLIGVSHTSDFFHKGPSITRNIAYLIINSLLKKKDRTLIFFIDSDQEFSTVVEAHEGERRLFLINFFYYLDRIFSHSKVDIVTGKVVGDPPVSPAVMMGNFLIDVCYFFKHAASHFPHEPCQLNRDKKNYSYCNQAQYHDMAELFGYSTENNPLPYCSSILEHHTTGECLKNFSRTIMGFFHGNHPTRRSFYIPYAPLLSIKPARTVYTGNYVLRAEALRYFIPFAGLRLRMAGPVLGRLLKARKGEKFVSVNLPMLHKRTIGQNNDSGYRAGIEHREDIIELEGEFERQFWGDVMLFTIERLIETVDYPRQNLSYAQAAQVVNNTRKEMKEFYEKKHKEIIQKTTVLADYITAQKYWWNKKDEFREAVKRFENFLKNVIHNFGESSNCYARIQSQDKIKSYIEKITRSIVRYPNDMKQWEQALNKTEDFQAPPD